MYWSGTFRLALSEPLRFGFQLVDELVDHLLVQWDRIIHVGPLIKGADELVLSESDRVWSSVGDSHLADLVLVERYQRRPPNQVSVLG